MAQPTTEHGHPAAKQKHTPGMVTQGTEPPKAATHALDPVLAEGIDPVLLHRLYPEADSVADASSQALAKGQKTAEEGAKLEAYQQASARPAAAP